MGMDHRKLWNTEIWVETRNLPISAEFLCFQIWYWPVIRGRIWHIWPDHRKLITTCSNDRAAKYCHSSSNGGILKLLDLHEILLVYLVDRLHLSAAVNYKYCTFGWVRQLHKINCYTWKICCSEPQNWEIFAVENCGPYWCVRHAAALKLTTMAGLITMSIETDPSPHQDLGHRKPKLEWRGTIPHPNDRNNY